MHDTPQARRQIHNDFSHDLQELTERDFHLLPVLDAMVSRGQEVPRIILPAGAYISTKILEQFSEYGRSATATFMLQAGNRIGREDSRHHAFFGKLFLQDTSHRQTEINVAVKRMDTPAEALGELAMFEHLRRLAIPTFRSIAYVRGKRESSYVVTELNKQVYTMDTVAWEERDASAKWLELRRAAATLALLHSNMIFHGDMEFKNVGFDEVGRPFIVDPEFSISLRDTAQDMLKPGIDSYDFQRSERLIQRKMSADFTDVFRSIKKFIIGTMSTSERPTSGIETFALYDEYLFGPYAQLNEGYKTKYMPILRRAYGRMYEQKQRLAVNGII